jgi:hypothetical protein
VDLQATVCSSCSYDIAARDPMQMVPRARRDLKVAAGLLLIGVAGTALCVLEILVSPPGGLIGGVPPLAAVAGLSIGGRKLRRALRCLAAARTIERVPSARVVTGRRANR